MTSTLSLYCLIVDMIFYNKSIMDMINYHVIFIGVTYPTQMFRACLEFEVELTFVKIWFFFVLK
jgi:hypothetical protein